MYRAPGTPARTNLELDGEDLTLKSVLLNGKKLNIGDSASVDGAGGDHDGHIDHGRSVLVIKGELFPEKAEEIFTLKIVVENKPEANLTLMG